MVPRDSIHFELLPHKLTRRYLMTAADGSSIEVAVDALSRGGLEEIVRRVNSSATA
ncbi:MAG: hypothetical protein ACRD12_16560 [Acidimicrobiales bacterium]